MKKLTLIGVFAFFLFSLSLTASASCGSIIVPASDGYEESIEEITDCDNPFGVTDPGYPIDLVIGGVDVEPEAVIAIPGEGTTDYARDGSQAFYRHEADGYIYFESYPDGPKLPLLPGTYTAVYKTFSFCVSEETQNKSFLASLYDVFIPTVHAMFCSGENKTSSVTFTLVPEEIEESTGASSVLFLPGIKASRLYKKDWLGFEDQLWIPNRNQDVRQLEMNEAGESINEVYTRDILDSVFGLGDVYSGISIFFDQLVASEKIASWQSFAYDWRYAVDDIVIEGTQYEDERRYVLELVEQLAAESYSGQVTLVGHSNGGLLAKAIMSELERLDRVDLVDRVILLASPQTGTPKAIGALLHGYDESILGGLLVRSSTARETMKNLPGVYSLLPTVEYFANTNTPVVVFEPNEATEQFIEAYGTTITDKNTLDAFLTATGDGRGEPAEVYDADVLSQNILQATSDLHSTILQSWRAPETVEVIEVTGIGLPTVSGFSYRPYVRRECTVVLAVSNCSLVTHSKPVPILSQLGDETVMTVSATGYQGEKKSYYFDLGTIKDELPRIKHHNFTEHISIQNLISNILLDRDNPTPFISSEPSVLLEPLLVLGVHSPVLPTVTNEAGQTTQVIFEGDFIKKIEDIPGSYIYYFGDTTYIVLPQSNLYDVALAGTGVGTVTLEIDHIVNNQQISVQRIEIEAVATSSQAVTAITDNKLTTVMLDKDGDGEFDYQIDAETNEVISLQVDTVEDVDEQPVAIISKKSSRSLVQLPQAVPQVAGVAVTMNELIETDQKYLEQLAELLIKLKTVLDLYENVIAK